MTTANPDPSATATAIIAIVDEGVRDEKIDPEYARELLHAIGFDAKAAWNHVKTAMEDTTRVCGDWPADSDEAN